MSQVFVYFSILWSDFRSSDQITSNPRKQIKLRVDTWLDHGSHGLRGVVSGKSQDNPLPKHERHGIVHYWTAT